VEGISGAPADSDAIVQAISLEVYASESVNASGQPRAPARDTSASTAFTAVNDAQEVPLADRQQGNDDGPVDMNLEDSVVRQAVTILRGVSEEQAGAEAFSDEGLISPADAQKNVAEQVDQLIVDASVVENGDTQASDLAP